tara:strand:- start:114 stop:599 length:486 start_codon:yes stop_codon:yes gene_type:complete
MTSEQREQWNLYSCVPRCIIALAALRGRAMSDEQFATQFASQIPEWKTRYGLMSVSDALQVIADLELATHAVHILDVPSLQRFMNEGHMLDYALVISHRHRSLQTDELTELHHCRLLLGFQPETPHLVLHNPTQDGNSYITTETSESLTEQQAEFIVLYRR